MLFSCNQSLVKLQRVVLAAVLTTQPHSRYHPDITSSSTFFSEFLATIQVARQPPPPLHTPHFLPSLSSFPPHPHPALLCFVFDLHFSPSCYRWEFKGGGRDVAVACRDPAAASVQGRASRRQQQLRAATAQRRANKRRRSPPNSNGRSGAAAGTAARPNAATEASTTEGPGQDDSPPRPVRPWRGRVI